MAKALNWIMPALVVAAAVWAFVRANYVLGVGMVVLFFVMAWVHRDKRS